MKVAKHGAGKDIIFFDSNLLLEINILLQIASERNRGRRYIIWKKYSNT